MVRASTDMYVEKWVGRSVRSNQYKSIDGTRVYEKDAQMYLPRFPPFSNVSRVPLHTVMN